MYKTNFKVFAHRKRFGKRTKLVSMMLAVLMVVSLTAASFSTTASAAATSPGDGADSDVTLQVTGGTSFSVTVPTELPIVVNARNQVEVATNARVVNNSSAPIDVVSATVEADNGWELVDIDTDFTKVPVDSKQFGMTIDDFATISGGDYATVNYDASVAVQSTSYNRSPIGHVVFVVDWNSGERLGPNDITYAVENTEVASYLATAAYDSSDYTYSNYPHSAALGTRNLPNSGTLTAPEGAIKITITSQSDGKSYTKSISGDSVTVDSLIPGIKYDYQMFDSSNEVIKSGKIIPTGKVRMINGGGNAFNIRDLGGWSADGGTLKYGVIYRGGELDDGTSGVSLSSDDKTFFKNFLGIKADIDLRATDQDNTESINSSVLGNDVDYYKANYFGYYDSNMRLNSYQTSKFLIAFNGVVDSLRNNKPIYIHCTEGADRTATLCFILEVLCGVSESDIDRDYELSSFGRAMKLRTKTEWVDMKNYLKENYSGSTLQEKVVNWLYKIGVSYDDINVIRQAMIDGNPQTINESYNQWGNNIFDQATAQIGYRLKSDTSSVSYQDGYVVSDYFPVTIFNSIYIETDSSRDFSGAHFSIAFYNENKERISENWFTQSDLNNPTKFFVASDGKSATTLVNDISDYRAYYARVFVAYEDINNVVIKKR